MIPPKKNLRPTNLDTNKIGKVTPTGANLRRKPNNIEAAMNRGTISNDKSPGKRGSQKTPVNDIYSTLNPISDDDDIGKKANFVSIDADANSRMAGISRGSIEAKHSIPSSSTAE
jgi:hypothetical protein